MGGCPVRTSSRADAEWRARVLHSFQAHVRSEQYVIDDYGRLAQQTTDPGVRLLIEQLLADERRHHGLFRAMAAEGFAPTSEGAAAMPVPDPSPDEVTELLDATSRFLAAEREDRDQLRRLRRELAAAGKASMWPLVVELMEIDTAKHIRILEELRTRLHDRAEHIAGEQRAVAPDLPRRTL
jgi:rubrerythrin